VLEPTRRNTDARAGDGAARGSDEAFLVKGDRRGSVALSQAIEAPPDPLSRPLERSQIRAEAGHLWPGQQNLPQLLVLLLVQLRRPLTYQK
jgi:hypothetical protein